jgi:hypothetical protein
MIQRDWFIIQYGTLNAQYSQIFIQCATMYKVVFRQIP